MNPPQRPRALRKPFVAAIVITDVDSERQLSTRTSDLILDGCFVVTTTPLNPGVKVQINHRPCKERKVMAFRPCSLYSRRRNGYRFH